MIDVSISIWGLLYHFNPSASRLGDVSAVSPRQAPVATFDSGHMMLSNKKLEVF
jgi:hypothetical protein